jgi:putative PEP-CTERM system histidine kinase
MNVVLVTHLICAAAFGTLAVMLLAAGSRTRTSTMLVVASVVTIVWALLIAAGDALPLGVDAVGDSVRDAVWLLFIRTLITPAEGSAPPWARTGMIAALSAAALVITIDVARLFLDASQTAMTQPQIILRILIAVLGLSLVENYYRNTPADSRWNVVPLTIAIGALFAYELFFYADVQLSRKIDTSLLAARALADGMCVPFLFLAVARNAYWRNELRLSHSAAFHGVTLISSGIFLLSVALVGLAFRRYGGQWGMILQVTTMFGAAIVLATVLSSETARSGIRMAILRNFFSYRYDYRVEWLRSIEVFSSGNVTVDLPERVIRAIADVVNSPGGVLFLRRDDGFVPAAFWNARVGADSRESADSEFIAAFRNGRWIQEFGAANPEAAAQPRPPWLVADESIWLAVPLPRQGELIGFVLLVEPRAPVHPDWEVFDLLRTLARQAASYVFEQQAERALVDTHNLQEYSKRFAFVVHDIKNLSSQLGLILSNARRHGDNPEFQADVLHTVENSVARMNNLLSQLRGATTGPARPTRPPIELTHSADALALVRELVAAHPQAPQIAITCDLPSVAVQIEPEPLRSVLAHLIDNAVEASGSAGRVSVTLGRDGERVTVDIIDEGPGMEVSFVRDELFRPFRSTKDSGFGIGAFQTRELIRAAGGQLEVITKPGAGTTMRVVLQAAGVMSHISPAA